MPWTRAPAPTRRFELKARLGEGTQGQVFLAEQVSPGDFRRRVALKLLQDEQDPKGAAARRMRDEARVLGRLHHPSIVSATDLVRVSGGWAVVLEYVPGLTLGQVRRKLWDGNEHFPPRAALEAAVQVLWALDDAWHADNGEGERLCLVHRDIKPANLMLTHAGDIRVLDFGVARATLEAREAETGAMTIIGTTLYMAPECLLGERATPRSDVYSTCATLVEMVTSSPLGRSPVKAEAHARLVCDALDVLPVRLPKGAPVDALRAALRDGLAVRAEERPDPRMLAATLGALAHATPGEGLHELAWRILDRETRPGEPVDGVLHEVHGESSGEELPPVTEALEELTAEQLTALQDAETRVGGDRGGLLGGLLGAVWRAFGGA